MPASEFSNSLLVRACRQRHRGAAVFAFWLHLSPNSPELGAFFSPYRPKSGDLGYDLELLRSGAEVAVLQFEVAPEPSTFVLRGFALLGLLVWQRRSSKLSPVLRR